MTTMPLVAPLLTVTVYGQPKPKGSLRSVGRGRMVEQVKGSKPWRVAVKEAALTARGINPLWPQVKPTALPTIQGPVRVAITVTVEKPASAPKRRRTWPITRTSGDLDKHLRNCFDALKDAGVYGDDSQVVQVAAAKVYPGEDPDALDSPGALIRIWPVSEGVPQ